MGLAELIKRAEEDLDAEESSHKSSTIGNDTLRVAVSSGIRKIKANMNFSRTIHIEPRRLHDVVKALQQFQHVWQMLCHPTFLYTNQHEKLFTEAIDMWNSYFSPSRWMESLFRDFKILKASQRCADALVFCILHLLQAPPSREAQFEKCISSGCAALITVVKSNITYRAQLMSELRVFTPPIETLAFLLRAEHSTIPLRENKWVLKNAACKKLADTIRRTKRGFSVLYGQIVSEELLAASLLLRRGDPHVTQCSSYPLDIRPAFWSVWQICCGIYQSATKTHDHFSIKAGKVLLTSVLSQFAVQLKEWSEECSTAQKHLHTREMVLFIFFVRLWRDFIGPDLYHVAIHKPLFKLVVASAIDDLPMPKRVVDAAVNATEPSAKPNPKKEKADAQSTNTARFFAMVWAVPPLGDSELEMIIDQGTVPWDPLFPRAFSVEAITSSDSPIYITRHVRHRLRQTAAN